MPDRPASELLRELEAERVARLFHEVYERLAPSFGYATREGSRVPFDEVPEPNRSLMIAVAQEVADALALPALIALVEQAERFGWDSHMRAALADLRRELGGGA